MKEISALELQRMREEGLQFVVLDVREPYETEVCSIGGMCLPMSELLDRLAEIPRHIPVVVHCQSGNRSCAVVDALSCRYGFTNLISLKGGIDAWRSEVDHSLECY